MNILVTGASGTIGEGLIPHLLRDGHDVRMLSRGAQQDARQWPEHVEPFPADIADPASLRGAATDCQVVVHITGIAKETRPAETFDRINVEGTRNVVKEARRAGVARFIYMSSLGAETGRSEYHQSKRRAEEIVRSFEKDWVILRSGNVYGPGDEVISTLLGMVRAMPILPLVGSGNQEFQPIWYKDLGAAVAKVIAREDLARATLDIAGEELTTTNDILQRLSKLTGKNPPRFNVPTVALSFVARIAELLGVYLPIDQQKLTMLLEGNVIAKTSCNGLTGPLGILPTSLADGLAELVDVQPEQLPGDGIGSIQRKQFRGDIIDSQLDASALMREFKTRITEIMPIDFASEPGSPTTIREGVTMTAEIPMRGTAQMRVEECADQHVTLATLRGHPIAGVVHFSAAHRDSDVLRFEVVVYAQAASIADWMILKTAGALAQNATWKAVVERMVTLSGGHSPNGVETNMRAIVGEELADADHWISEMILARRRFENAVVTES